VRTTYRQFTDTADLPVLITALDASTLVFDVEPLVADWDGTQEALDRGITRILGLVASIPGVQAVCFATNSARRPAVLPPVPGIEVIYLVSARKPLSVASYRRLPLPGVVIGDQVLTDGLLARRLGYSFLHYRPPHAGPAGPRLLDGTGQLARPLIFRR
jgi:hypothetical protein